VVHSWLQRGERVIVVQVYYASEEFGPDDIRTSGGYFHMADVFDQQGNVTVAQSLYRQVSLHSVISFAFNTDALTNSSAFLLDNVCISVQ